MEPPKPVKYFVGINAHSHNEIEFRSNFKSYDRFYRKKRAGYCKDKIIPVANQLIIGRSIQGTICYVFGYNNEFTK